jgi:photosystem II stability/assembly factor-like uncharacterized protein
MFYPKFKKMKKLFVLAPAMLTVVVLLDSCVLTEKQAGSKTAMATSFTGAVPDSKPQSDSVRTPFASVNNIVYTSADGGQTWQDISRGLPETGQLLSFFAGGAGLYLQEKNVMYRSTGGLTAPVWEKEDIPDLQSGTFWPSTAIAFNRSGVMAFNYQGQVYQKAPAAAGWQPIHTNFIKHALRAVFETADGAVFLGYDDGLYKSADRGTTWSRVDKGLVTSIVEQDGVLLATGQNGIMRSADNGEHWQYVISEGGLGIAIERINGGFAAITYNATTQSRRIRISSDGGATWQAIDAGLPPSQFISSIKQTGSYLVCGHPDGIFRSADRGKTWTKVSPGIAAKVFTLYASGTVLYAVAGAAGC